MKRPVTFVLVDDEEVMEFLFQASLEDEIAAGNVELLYFNRAQGLLDFIENNGVEKIDFVVSDINMPEMDGISMTLEIRKNHKDLPIYLSSAYDQEDNADRIKECNIKDYFQKPINIDAIKKIILDMD